MVRVMLKESESINAGGQTFTGPAELVFYAWVDGPDTRSSGEYVLVAGLPVQTLDHVREWYWAVYFLVPFALLMGFKSLMAGLKR